MKPVKFEQQNFVWGRPSGTTDDQVGSMPAYKGVEQESGWPLTISCWEPSEEELAEIIRTKKIWLRIYGNNHPVVSVSGNSPW